MGISNVTAALKKTVAAHEIVPLDDVVQAINNSLQLAVVAANQAGSLHSEAMNAEHKARKLELDAIGHRLDAARLLSQLRRRVEAEGHDWWKWQEGKFDRSRRDIERLLKIGRSADPEGAAAEERARNAAYQRDHRASSDDATDTIDVSRKERADSWAREAQSRAAFRAKEASERAKEHELRRKLKVEIVNIGFRTIAKTLHTDVGGEKTEMQRLNDVRNQLLAYSRRS